MPRFPLLILSVFLATAAQAQIYIAGPMGCSLLAGWEPNDGGMGTFLQPGHWGLDYVVLETWGAGCWIDGEGFSMEADPGKSETRTGGCDFPDIGTQSGTFTLTYEAADRAILDFSEWQAPLVFAICPVN